MTDIKTPEISVIIPVYGVEKYIERCARSLFEQTLQDGIEFIFVDDASPDNSMEILQQVIENYPSRKKQIKIVRHKENLGSAKARLSGLSVAEGDFIANCDSDDWVESDMYENLLNQAVFTGSDMVWCDYFESTEIKDIVRCQAIQENKESIIFNYLAHLKTNKGAYMWNRIFKKDLISDDFSFPAYDMTEDFVTVIQLLLKSKSVSYISKPLYHYFINPLSIVRNPSQVKISSNYKGIVCNTQLVLDLLDKNGLSNQLRDGIICKKLSCKEVLSPLLSIKEYRSLWKNTFKDINKSILLSKSIPVRLKFKSALILCNLWPLCSVLILLKRHILSKFVS